MAQTIEDVNDRTLLQQFHSLYKKQDEIETNVDAKVEQEATARADADAGLQSSINANATSIANLQNSKVDKETGKGLSTNDFTDEYKTKIDTNATNIANNTTQITALQRDKQDKLTAGANITIDANNVISASGGASGRKYQHYMIVPSSIYRPHWIIENNQIEAFTVDTLKSYLTSKGYTTLKYAYPVASAIYAHSDEGDNPHLDISNVDGIYVDKNNILQFACYGNQIIFDFKDGIIGANKKWKEVNVDFFIDMVTES